MLNIKIKKGTENGSWIKVSCPFPDHEDKNPSAGINVETGVFNCFTCGESKHIINVLMDSICCTYKDALEMLELDLNSTQKPITANLKTKAIIPIENFPEQQVISKKKFTFLQTDIYQYEYARLRGFTNKFCAELGITVAVSGYYIDYMIIPVKGNGIDSFEARKVMEYEYLLKYFKINNGSYNNLKVQYKQLENIEKNEYSIYLNKPKTLYPKDSCINQTLFNYDNLNFNDTLYLVEGLGSVPKIYTHITKNITCTLGSQLTVAQIQLLQKFKKIICIPDNDKAGTLWLINLNKHLKNLWVNKILVEDTENNYINEILNTSEVEASRYFLNKFYKGE
jgi:DNA primase